MNLLVTRTGDTVEVLFAMLRGFWEVFAKELNHVRLLPLTYLCLAPYVFL